MSGWYYISELEESNAPEKPEYPERIQLKGSCQMLSFVETNGKDMLIIISTYMIIYRRYTYVGISKVGFCTSTQEQKPEFWIQIIIKHRCFRTPDFYPDLIFCFCPFGNIQNPCFLM